MDLVIFPLIARIFYELWSLSTYLHERVHGNQHRVVPSVLLKSFICPLVQGSWVGLNTHIGTEGPRD